MLKWIDSHCHLDRIDGYSLAQLLENAKHAQVIHMLCISVALADFPKLQAIATHAQVSLSAGIHPSDEEVLQPDWEQLAVYAKDPKVIAIGETGLDYHYGADHKLAQQAAFIEQIILAKALKKPLVIHTRAARQDTIQILKTHQASDVRGVMHCFTEDWETAKQALDLGFYISFSGIMTFANAHELRAVAKKVPLDCLLIETDSPYLAPVPYRGKENQPAWVVEVAKQIASLHGVSLQEVSDATVKNFCQLFNVDPIMQIID